jgi:EmrB/QacA subfamily drug resistance transporter
VSDARTAGADPDLDAGDVRMDSVAGRWVLTATVLGSGMAMLDSTVVNLALPRIGEDLDASFSQLQWIVNAYTLTLAALIILGGSLGDRMGRRRIFVIGAAWFTVASVLCAVAPTSEMLIGARALQGVGGALLTPGSLAIIQSSFASADRPRAIGAWSGLGGVAAGIGPFLGGWLVDVATWRSIFLINVPLGIVVVMIAARHVPESRDTTSTGRLDVPGAVLGAAALAAITYGLTAQEWLICAIGAVIAVAFVVFEMRSRAPMVPMSIFRSAQFSATNVVTFLLYGAFAAALFLLGLVLQGPLDYSPLEAGAATVPLTIMMLLFSARAGAIAQRIGPRIPMTVGPLLCAAGLALLTRVEPGVSYVSGVLPGMLVFATGLTLTVAPLTTTALSSVAAHLAGVASGVNNAVARTGSLVFVAAIPVVAGFTAGAAVDDATLLDGYGKVLWASAGVAVAAGIVSAVWVRRIEPEIAPTEPSPFCCPVSSPPVSVTAAAAD